MRADEPDLFDAHRGRECLELGLLPQGSLERLPMLIDRDGVQVALDYGANFDVVESVNVSILAAKDRQRHTQRSDGIEYAQAFDTKFGSIVYAGGQFVERRR
jgi:hypothetical protein